MSEVSKAAIPAALAADPPLVWVDLEMTGLNPETCAIVEIATILTDGDLNLIAEGPSLVIHQPESVLAGMDDFVRKMHTTSGLLERIRESKVTVAAAEAATLAFVKQHCPEGKSPLAGNSVWRDKTFLERYMPAFNAHLHYRIVDVSSIKELVRRWYPGRVELPQKPDKHRALDDIRESIEELKLYRQRVFIP